MNVPLGGQVPARSASPTHTPLATAAASASVPLSPSGQTVCKALNHPGRREERKDISHQASPSWSDVSASVSHGQPLVAQASPWHPALPRRCRQALAHKQFLQGLSSGTKSPPA